MHFLARKKFVFCYFENENRVINIHAQHDKDQFFYNRTVVPDFRPLYNLYIINKLEQVLLNLKNKT